MAEVQSSTRAGESAARFIEFVMMQAQNASLFLGLMPNPHTNKPEVNLELARMFIDQLAMIQEKTRGNLSTEEGNVLRNALTNLQMAFYEVAQGGGAELPATDEPPAPAATTAAPEDPAGAPAVPASGLAETPGDAGGESKKRFSKSYGS